MCVCVYIYTYYMYFIFIYIFFQYKFKQKCHGDIDNYNIIEYQHPSVINYCTAEDVPDNINFYVKRDENRGNLSGTHHPLILNN